MKRLAIVCLYNKDGKIEKHAQSLIADLKTVSTSLYVVFNGTIHDDIGKKHIQEFADAVFERENIGLDGGAYKETIFSFIGWKEVCKYDELVLCNDTFFGPFWGFESIFSTMNERPCDFWGITMHPGNDEVPKHIQAYFLAFRMNEYMQKYCFDFWNKLSPTTTHELAVEEFEIGISQYLFEKGVVADSFVACKEDGNDPTMVRSFYNTKYMGLPIIKRKRFVYEGFAPNDLRKTIEYIRRNTNYDVDDMLGTIIDSSTTAQLDNALDLSIISPHSTREFADCKSAVFSVLFEGNEEEAYSSFLDGLPRNVDIFVWTDSRVIEEKYKNISEKKVFFVDCKKYNNIFSYLLSWINVYSNQYDNVLFVNNRRRMDVSMQDSYEEASQLCTWENLLMNAEHYTGEIEELCINRYVGGLFPHIDREYCNEYRIIDYEKAFEIRTSIEKRLSMSRITSDYLCEHFSTDSFLIRTSIIKEIASVLVISEIEEDFTNYEHAISEVIPSFVKNRRMIPERVICAEQIRAWNYRRNRII